MKWACKSCQQLHHRLLHTWWSGKCSWLHCCCCCCYCCWLSVYVSMCVCVSLSLSKLVLLLLFLLLLLLLHGHHSPIHQKLTTYYYHHHCPYSFTLRSDDPITITQERRQTAETTTKRRQSKAKQGKARQENSSKTQNKEMGIYKNKTITQPKPKNNTKSKRKVLVPPHLHLLLLLPLLLHIPPINARLVACAHTWAGARGQWVPSFPSYQPFFFNKFLNG